MSKNIQVVSHNYNLICPLCGTYGAFDLVNCTHCGAHVKERTETHIRGIFVSPEGQKKIKTVASTVIKRPISAYVEYFERPDKLWDPEELLNNRDIVPKERGIYGWYFDKISNPVPQKAKYIQVEGMHLLYIGIAGGDLFKQGNLKKRIIDNHLKGNYKGSTLAHSLHAVLNIDKNNKEERMKWMIKHMKVAWITNSDPKPVETHILTKYGHILPLNLDENEDRNPFAEELSRLRSKI